MSEIDNPLERIDELTAERDRFGDRIDDLAAEVIRLRACQAARDKTIAELVAANTLLVTDRTALEAQLAAADGLATAMVIQAGLLKLGCGGVQRRIDIVADRLRSDSAAYRAIRGGV